MHIIDALDIVANLDDGTMDNLYIKDEMLSDSIPDDNDRPYFDEIIEAAQNNNSLKEISLRHIGLKNSKKLCALISNHENLQKIYSGDNSFIEKSMNADFVAAITSNKKLKELEINNISLDNPLPIFSKLPLLESVSIKLDNEYGLKVAEQLMQHKPENLHNLGFGCHCFGELLVPLLEKYPDLVIDDIYGSDNPGFALNERNKNVCKAINHDNPLQCAVRENVLMPYMQTLKKENMPKAQDFISEKSNLFEKLDEKNIKAIIDMNLFDLSDLQIMRDNVPDKNKNIVTNMIAQKTSAEAQSSAANAFQAFMQKRKQQGS